MVRWPTLTIGGIILRLSKTEDLRHKPLELVGLLNSEGVLQGPSSRLARTYRSEQKPYSHRSRRGRHTQPVRKGCGRGQGFTGGAGGRRHDSQDEPAMAKSVSVCVVENMPAHSVDEHMHRDCALGEMTPRRVGA
jgi:hypothetical protein